MNRIRVLVAAVGVAVAIALFPAPAEATHVCLTRDDGGFGLVGETVHRAECDHYGPFAVTFFLCRLAGVGC